MESRCSQVVADHVGVIELAYEGKQLATAIAVPFK